MIIIYCDLINHELVKIVKNEKILLSILSKIKQLINYLFENEELFTYHI